jgi:hypothetical protein
MISATSAITNSYGVQVGTMLGTLQPTQTTFPNQPIQTKYCNFCNQHLPITEFAYGHTTRCKKCRTSYECTRLHKLGVRKPYNENKGCTLYFGSHIAEKLLLSTFSNVNKAPMNNPGYDFVCGKGFKVDVKASCIIHGERKLKSGVVKQTPYWLFNIKFNDVADQFAFIAFDSRDSLVPLHFWIVPADVVNKKYNVTIFPSTFHKWSKYERPIDKMLSECTTTKNGDDE